MPIPAQRRALYPPNWPELSLLIREQRAGWHCEWCHACDGHEHPETGSVVVLTVAHLNHDPTDNRPQNLAALCQKCHLGYDRERHIATRRQRRLGQGEFANPNQKSFWTEVPKPQMLGTAERLELQRQYMVMRAVQAESYPVHSQTDDN